MHILKVIRYLIFIGLVIIGCSPIVKTDIKSFMENPAEYKGKEVIITTDLKSLLSNPSVYEGKKIELSGKVSYDGTRNFFTWNFILTEDDKAIRCYEKEYRIETWIMPVKLVRRAFVENGKITVVGKFWMKLKLPELELDRIEYKGEAVSTDYKTAGIRVPLR